MKLELHWKGPCGAGLFSHTAEGMENLLRGLVGEAPLMVEDANG